MRAGSNVVRTENVKDGLAGGDQMVGDDPAMAAPPQGLGAHDRAPRRFSEATEFAEAGSKCVAESVVGVVVEAFVLPERVRPGWDGALPSAQAAERGDRLIANVEPCQSRRQRVPVVLRIRARAGNSPNVDDEADLGEMEKFDESLDRARRMSDGVVWIHIWSELVSCPLFRRTGGIMDFPRSFRSLRPRRAARSETMRRVYAPFAALDKTVTSD